MQSAIVLQTKGYYFMKRLLLTLILLSSVSCESFVDSFSATGAGQAAAIAYKIRKDKMTPERLQKLKDFKAALDKDLEKE